MKTEKHYPGFYFSVGHDPRKRQHIPAAQDTSINQEYPGEIHCSRGKSVRFSDFFQTGSPFAPKDRKDNLDSPLVLLMP